MTLAASLLVLSSATVLTGCCDDESPGGCGGSGNDGNAGGGTGGSAGQGGGGAQGGSGGQGGSIPDCTVVLDTHVTVDTEYDASCVLRIEGQLDIFGDATLTLLPGLRVEMATDARIWIGRPGDPGRIIAAGTPQAPILITSANDTPAPGDWHSIIFTADAKAGTRFEHVIMEYGGGTQSEFPIPAPLVLNAPGLGTPGRLAVDNCTFRHNAQAGLLATVAGPTPEDGWFASFEGNTFEDNGDYAMSLAANLVGSVAANTTADQPILVPQSGIFGADVTWPNLGVPYILDGFLPITGTTTVLTFDGLTIQMTLGSELHLASGKLFATDTVFESASTAPSPGDWVGIGLIGSSQIHLDGCRVSHAHSDSPVGGVLFINTASPLSSSVVDTVFSDNIGAADIWIWASPGNVCPHFTTNAQPPNTFDLALGCGE